jgi:hypothetical protein
MAAAVWVVAWSEGVAIILTARLPEANAVVRIMSLPRWVDVSSV